MSNKELAIIKQEQFVQPTESESVECTQVTTSLNRRIELEGEVQNRFKTAAGTDRLELAESLVGQANLLAQRWTGVPVTLALTMALQILEEIKPSDGLDSMLAVQMIGVHFAATATLSRAGGTESAEAAEILIRRATRLMRLFAQQAELMAKLKGKVGQQKVVVEHVNVNAGGRAVVGTIAAVEGANVKQ